MNFYLVGGCVRDQLLGIKPKDIDIAVEAPSWQEFREEILLRSTQVYCEEPEYFRIKALNPEYGPVDYVMCRKDGFYTDGRRPDSVEICSIHEDLTRRDFTINAMAKDLRTGELIDLFQGQKHLKARELHAVGEPSDRMAEDALRWFRALRFCVTKGFTIGDPDLLDTMDEMIWSAEKSFKNISTDRIRDEIRRCFHHSTSATILEVLENFNEQGLKHFLLFLSSRGIWLNPTTQKKAGNGE